MNVALVHYWLVARRGGEKVLEALAEIFPRAAVFTHVYDPEAAPEFLKNHEVRTSFIQRLPRASENYRRYLPLMPLALERLDLSGFDLVISSESGPAKGVRLDKGAKHLCYCHTPMRYLWSHYDEYRQSAGPLTRLGMSCLKHPLRRWDKATAARVDRFVANSETVAQRIEQCWGRESVVVPPPVDTEAFGPPMPPEDYYLVAGEMVGYKRFDLAIEACNTLGRPLVVIGKGPEEARLKAMAGPTITFLGHAPREVMVDRMRRCRALLFPQEEDFGITAVEAMASGRPVLAFGRGGALETVIPGQTGFFFKEQTPQALARAVEEFEAREGAFDPEKMQTHARQFDTRVFVARMRSEIEALIGQES